MRSVLRSLGCCALALAGCQAQKNPIVPEEGDFGLNPSGVTLDVYVPPAPAAKPPVVLALHTCFGSGPIYAGFADYTGVAEEKGFIVMYPSSHNDSNCWDNASPQTLMREGGGDSTTLVRMVQHVLKKYNGDPDRVFVTGASSGCMMTNVLTAAYPDVFAATSCYSGVPAGCLMGSRGSSPLTATNGCAEGIHPKSAEEWKTIAQMMFPWGAIRYPRVQTWHGKADEFVSYLNLDEQIKQWSAVMDVPFRCNETDVPAPGITKMVYGDGTRFVAYSVEGVGHVVPPRIQDDMLWFGL